jgi:regulator of sirC expression with transglutaminase-like and TPR domain
MILVRMLRNHKGLYLERGDWERVARSADRRLKLSPDTAEALRDRGLAYRELGYAKGAREDLARYLQLLPEADDVEYIRANLIDLGTAPTRVN